MRGILSSCSCSCSSCSCSRDREAAEVDRAVFGVAVHTTERAARARRRRGACLPCRLHLLRLLPGFLLRLLPEFCPRGRRLSAVALAAAAAAIRAVIVLLGSIFFARTTLRVRLVEPLLRVVDSARLAAAPVQPLVVHDVVRPGHRGRRRQPQHEPRPRSRRRGGGRHCCR